MRIVAGRLGSRRLIAPRGATRPTSDRARESLFAALASVEGAACLDLFAGSGALGLEALSRGASSCVFCEIERAALDALAANIEALGVGERCTVRRVDARRLLRDDARAGRRYDLVLIDPPYPALQSFLPVLRRSLPSVVREGGRVVVESPAAVEVDLAGLDVLSTRRVGAARLTILAAGAGGAR
jgi:16S rRNA (guanine966-N2)-methyltransferase